MLPRRCHDAAIPGQKEAHQPKEQLQAAMQIERPRVIRLNEESKSTVMHLASHCSKI